MEFDKVKVALFISTMVLVIVSIGAITYSVKQHGTVQQLQADLKNKQEETTNKIPVENDQSQNEKLIKEFYQTVYNYEKSQKEISMTTVKELATDNVYQDLQSEINVNNSYSPQQNVIQKSTVSQSEIKILTYKSSGNIQQYLVTAPINQVFNGTKNDFELNQIIQIKDNKIIQRTTIQLEKE